MLYWFYQVKTVTRMFDTHSPTLFGRTAQIPLDAITISGEECVEFATETATAFHGVILLLHEILQAVQSGRGQVENQAKEARAELESTLTIKAFLDKQTAANQARQAEAEQKV